MDPRHTDLQSVLRRNIIALQEMASLLASNASFTDIAQRSLDSVAQALGATRGRLRLYDSVDRCLHLVAVYGETPEWATTAPDWQTVPFRPGLQMTLVNAPGAVVLDDVLASDLPANEKRLLAEEGSRAAAGIALRARGQTVGTLVLFHSQPEYFKPDAGQLLDVLGAHVALALENWCLQQGVKDQLEHLQRVLHISEIATSTLDLDTMLPGFADALVAHLDVTECFIVLYDAERDLLIPAAASSPHNETYRSMQVTADMPSVSRHVLDTLQPEVVEDVFHSPWVAPQVAHLFSSKSLLAVPMVAHGVPLGALLVGERRRNRLFTDDVKHEVSILASQIALAVRHAQAHEEVRRQAQDLAFLHDMAVDLMTLQSPREMGAHVAKALESFFPDTYAAVFTHNPHTGYVEALAFSSSQDHRLEESYHTETRLEAGEGLIGAAYATGKVIRVDDVRRDPRYVPFFPETLSEICVPLATGGQVIGVIDVQSARPARFGMREERVLRSLAVSLAAALEKARLYADLQAQSAVTRQAYDELLLLDQRKDEFIQNLTHELRNPLTFLKGFADLMLEEGLGPVTDEQRETLEAIVRRTDDLIALVTDTLELLREDLERIEWEVVDLANVLTVCLLSARVVAREEHLDLSWDLPPDLPPVAGSPRRLRQVFDNLLVNAIKFTPPGRAITVRAETHGRDIVVCVSDEGIGIPKDQLERIFERFHQAREEDRGKRGGAGLGLAISRRIVEAHGGRIWAESEEGKGSTFCVALPILEEKERAGVERQVVGAGRPDRGPTPGL